MNEKKKKILPIILLAATGLLAIIGVFFAMGAATPITEVVNNLLQNPKYVDLDDMQLDEMAQAYLGVRVTIVAVIACVVAALSLCNLVISLLRKTYTLGFLTVAIMEIAYAVYFAIEPVKLSAYFDLTFWMLIVISCISFVFIFIDIIRRFVMDPEYRKRGFILIIIGVVDIVLSTIFFFAFGDNRASYVEGMLKKYEISMALYSVVSIFVYGVYTIVIGAVLAIAASIFMKSNKKS